MTTVDFHCKINNTDHRTSEISIDRLIVGRGQEFLITLQTSNPEFLELTVGTGPEPAEHLGTKSVFGVSRESVGKKPWKAEIKEASGTSVTLFITSPADASIGNYTLSVKTDPNATEDQNAGTFVLLFNPWCKEDWVYLKNEAERQEYVMNEHGIQYTGTSCNISGWAWDFGQFEEDILDICLKILDYNPKCSENPAEDFSERWSPIYVGRVVSAMVNCNDDRGVLQGNWSTDFRNAVSPMKWTGSVNILRKWKELDGHPVKYGQCWVFDGVMCTVMRCLGIPCRLITNFQSAHDVHGNLLIDYFYTDHGVEDSLNNDSIWNFHVWVEGWMRRPDLSGESLYDGWQVLDPTPQELSDVDLHCKINNADHWTNEISIDQLIVRRGQEFLITLQTSNPESLELTVQTGPEPAEHLGTKSVFGVSRESVGKKPWKADIKEASGTSVTLFITSPADASIGKYTLSVKTDPNATEDQNAGTFVLLFNPWCKEDWVYMTNEAERQEYVMNEHGIQFTGTSCNISGWAWDFGQFEEDILDICLKILDYNPKCLENPAEDFSERWSPIYVGRVVSAMVNCNDDRGVLEGNWSSNFSNGVSPMKWTGSVDILRQWNASDGHPVKYGQCWVFGGVMCTVMRCLGIPCRLITNFQSAHDVHGNLLIDYFYTDHGVEDSLNNDSIWNFHVWVEGWMRRPDLSGSEDSTYDGWQVLDPTLRN